MQETSIQKLSKQIMPVYATNFTYKYMYLSRPTPMHTMSNVHIVNQIYQGTAGIHWKLSKTQDIQLTPALSFNQMQMQHAR